MCLSLIIPHLKQEFGCSLGYSVNPQKIPYFSVKRHLHKHLHLVACMWLSGVCIKAQ